MAYTTVNKSTDYFNTKLYTGNGGNQTITGVGFKPDWTWFKSRDAGNSHALVDIVRGTNKVLYSDSTSTEQPISAQTFNSDGYAIVQDGGANSINSNGSTKVAWSWKAGGGQGSSNTDGSINTTYTSANTTAGFSICQYTGNGSNATVGHGLGVAPKMVIVKKTSGTSQWYTYHASIGATKYLDLESTAAESTSSANWNNIAPTTTVFSLGTNSNVNASGQTYIAYCFAEKQGYSKMGIYKGNSNPDGPFIYTGFAPVWVLCKSVSGSGSPGGNDWNLLDNKMTPYNMHVNKLFPNTSGVENTSAEGTLDMVSNGFKPRGTGGSEKNNNSGTNYIYIALGQSIVGTNNVPNNAR